MRTRKLLPVGGMSPAGVFSGPQGTYVLDEQGRPIAPPGQKKRLPIDVLLD